MYITSVFARWNCLVGKGAWHIFLSQLCFVHVSPLCYFSLFLARTIPRWNGALAPACSYWTIKHTFSHTWSSLETGSATGTQDINCVWLETDGMDLFMLDITEGIPKEKEKRRERKNRRARKKEWQPSTGETDSCLCPESLCYTGTSNLRPQRCCSAGDPCRERTIATETGLFPTHLIPSYVPPWPVIQPLVCPTAPPVARHGIALALSPKKHFRCCFRKYLENKLINALLNWISLKMLFLRAQFDISGLVYLARK